ncbi:regulator of G-protein signaling-like protein [Camelus ferus]|nr:regulator of G-protein signaling-like protein [Camelus ferus]
MMRWRKADQWLLQRCIGGVRGMWRFCTYLKGSAGEELVDFWVLVEKILSIDEMDLEVRDSYLSLLFVLKATHLQESSRVVTLCNTNIKSLLNLSIWHPNQSTTRREILSHMQKVALFKLQSYWLPNFYTHAKGAMAKEESCQVLMQEYETRLYSICYTHVGGLPLNMSIRKCHHPQRWYSSRKTKRKMWQLIDPRSWSLEMDLKPESNLCLPQELCPQEKVVIQLSPLKEASSKERRSSFLEKDILCTRKSNMKKKAKSHLHMEGLFETAFSTHLRTVTPIISHSHHMTMRKAIKQNLSLGYTHWALCADACAGGPFRDHLKKQNLKEEIQLLDLWQDLHHFLSVLMSNRKTGKAIFRHMLGNRICELYLNEQIGPRLPLKSQTIKGLKELLPSGDANPWIPRAQKEICQTQTKVVSTRWHKRDSISKEENLLLYKRFEESLELSQGLTNMEEMESMQWQKIATEDLKQGGSLRVERRSPVFLAATIHVALTTHRFPWVRDDNDDSDKADMWTADIRGSTAHSPSRRHQYNLRKYWAALESSRTAVCGQTYSAPEITTQMSVFTLVDMEKMSFEELCYQYPKVAIEKISDDYKTYCKKAPQTEEILQCDAPVIKEVSHMSHISTTMLLLLQSYVMKSLEDRWFKDYQDLFPHHRQEREHETLTSTRKSSKTTATYLHGSQKRGLLKMISFIKSFCKYRRCMSNLQKRREFEDYLHLEVHDNKENFSISPNIPGRLATNPTSVRCADHENGDITLVKRRIFGHRIIIVNFAINDLYFFSEMEKFNDLVSSAHVLQVNRAYNENDVILMKSKINIILKLYLHSEVPPRLRVNISESQKDAILAAISEGHLDRSIFHGAIMALFPVIMYFWKRFCVWKAICSYFQYRGKNFEDKKTASKSVCKYPPWSGGDHAVLRFTLLRGIEWLRPQQREAAVSSVQNSSSSILTQSRHVFSSMQLCPVPGWREKGRETLAASLARAATEIQGHWMSGAVLGVWAILRAPQKAKGKVGLPSAASGGGIRLYFSQSI